MEATPHRGSRSRRIGLRVAAGLAVTLIATAITLLRLTHTAPSSSNSTALPSGLTISLPPNYGPILDIVGDPTGAGSWLMAPTANGQLLTIFSLSTTGSLRSWNAIRGMLPSGPTGLTVDNSGNVWLGVNQTLVSLNPTTSTVQTVPIPTPADDPAGEAYRPPAFVGHHDVAAVASDPTTGDIAIAMTEAGSVLIYLPTSGQFTSLTLPEATSPTGVAYDSTGDLGVSLVNYVTHMQNTVVEFPPLSATGSSTKQEGVLVSVPDSTTIGSSTGSDFVVGSLRPSILSVGRHLAVEVLSLGLDRKVETVAPWARPIPSDGGNLVLMTGLNASGALPDELVKMSALSQPNSNLSVPASQAASILATVPLTAERCLATLPQVPGATDATSGGAPCGLPMFLAEDSAGDLWFTTTTASRDQVHLARA
jgi:hypothetical protein